MPLCCIDNHRLYCFPTFQIDHLNKNTIQAMTRSSITWQSEQEINLKHAKTTSIGEQLHMNPGDCYWDGQKM